MKKQLSLMIIALLTLGLLAGCGSKTDSANSPEASNEQTQTTETPNAEVKTADLKLKDGTYHVEGSADEKGWIPTTDVVIENGKISAVTFDDIDATGTFKSQAVANGDYDMTINGAKASWTDEIADFAAAIVSGKVDVYNITLDDSGKTDAVSSCTITVAPYVELVKSALEQAKIQS